MKALHFKALYLEFFFPPKTPYLYLLSHIYSCTDSNNQSQLHQQYQSTNHNCTFSNNQPAIASPTAANQSQLHRQQHSTSHSVTDSSNQSQLHRQQHSTNRSCTDSNNQAQLHQHHQLINHGCINSTNQPTVAAPTTPTNHNCTNITRQPAKAASTAPTSRLQLHKQHQPTNQPITAAPAASTNRSYTNAPTTDTCPPTAPTIDAPPRGCRQISRGEIRTSQEGSLREELSEKSTRDTALHTCCGQPWIVRASAPVWPR